MSGFWDTIGRFGQLFMRGKTGELYQRGYNDARAGHGKSPDIIKMKSHLSSPSITAEMKRMVEMGVDAYNEGFQDGLEREEMELRTRRNIRFDD